MFVYSCKLPFLFFTFLHKFYFRLIAQYVVLMLLYVLAAAIFS